MRSRRLVAALGVVLVTACTPSVGSVSTTTTTRATTTTTAPTTTTTLPDCTPSSEVPSAFETSDPSATSVALSQELFPCALDVIVASGSMDSVVTAVSLARDGEGPVLVDGPGVAGEIARLGATSVTWVGRGEAPSYADRSVVPPPGSPAPDPPATAGDVIWVWSGSVTGAVLVASVAESRGDGFLAVGTGDDLRRADPDVRRALDEAGAIVPLGLDADQRAQLDVVLSGATLPGDRLTFDGTRLVAFYGNPTTPLLGVLGEQGPAGTLDRIEPLAVEYAADGLDVIPAYEIIATVASSRAGADGDYSDEADPSLLRPWIDFAAANGVYVLLDLQPGRTDFLTQAKRYEEFLRLPNVGLALDPEWRLGPNQVHLRQIGTVSAAEINEVSRWLTGIVREEHLPQKFFLLHQFRLSMISDRSTVETPPELFTVIQMDGQGPLATKYQTFAAITAGALDEGWHWGWKNFYDEDSPMATPAQVLELDPTVVYVSFQ